jgi:hypothetical protein
MNNKKKVVQYNEIELQNEELDENELNLEDDDDN